MKSIILNKLPALLFFMGCISVGLSQPCVFTHTLSGPVTSNEGYRAQTTIASTQAVSTGVQVTYDAGTSITLSPGFEAVSGCTFHAFIGGCNVGIDDLKQERFGIANFPNPFTRETRIVYFLESSETVSLQVYNAFGQPVATLVDQQTQVAGEHERIFDASHLPPGVYMYTLQAGEKSVAGRMVLQE